MSNLPFDAPRDAHVLVAVVNDPDDLARAREQGWYRIPLARAPSRIGADFLALYQTAAFPPAERWAVRFVAPVRGYRLTTRRALIPEQPAHPRADERYHRVDIGPLWPLPNPIPSLRLRRITFIRTTLGRLLEAQEINDLWLRSAAHERLWEAIRQAGLADAVEREYPLLDDAQPDDGVTGSAPYTADFAAFGACGRLAITVADGFDDLDDCIRERASLDYPLARGGWRSMAVATEDPLAVASILNAIRALRVSASATERKNT